MKVGHRSYRSNFFAVAKRKWSTVGIPYKQDFFFSGFLFATAKVASKTAMIYFHTILHPAVHIYDSHIFITSSPSFHGFITNQFNDLLPVGLVAQLIRVLHRYRTGQGSNPVQA